MTIFESGKVKIICAADCGNAPKKILIKEFITALALNNQDFLLNNITDDIRWNLIGERLIQGKEEFLQNLSIPEKAEIQIEHIITHGNTGAANGVTILNGKTLAFCHVYLFTSAKQSKIKEITTYVIKI